jgi:choline monooxygenase
MTVEAFDSELERFDPGIAIEAARTPPSSWYLAPEFLRQERRRVFLRSWQAVGRLDQVAAVGDYFTGVIVNEPYVVLRDSDGNLRAFFNVCRHHATRVAAGEGRVESLVCPYHGWTYGLDGRLRKAPRMAGVRDFDRERFGLRPMTVDSYGPLVFIHPEPDPPPLRDQLRGLDGNLSESDLAGLRFFTRREYRLRCNWKVYIDNYLDGGYHVPVLHRGLASQLAIDGYRTELFERLSIQSCAAAAEPAPDSRGDFADRIGSRAVYAFLYPNFMLNRYGPILDTNRVVPLSPDETLVVFDYYFRDTEGEPARRFIDRSLAASQTVQEEDIGICEAVQEGLASSAYDRGVYAPRVETAMYHFHRLLAADLRRHD